MPADKPPLHICSACGDLVRLKPDLQALPEVPGTCTCGHETVFYLAALSLPVWGVYDHPLDFPRFYVARLHLAVGSGRVVPTGKALTANTLEELREKAPGGLTRLPRFPEDDPCLVETWF